MKYVLIYSMIHYINIFKFSVYILLFSTSIHFVRSAHSKATMHYVQNNAKGNHSSSQLRRLLQIPSPSDILPTTYSNWPFRGNAPFSLVSSVYSSPYQCPRCGLLRPIKGRPLLSGHNRLPNAEGCGHPKERE